MNTKKNLLFITIFIWLFTNSLHAISLNNGQYKSYSFDKLANYKYTVKLDVTSGDCDLYGHHSGYPTQSNYHRKSDNPSGQDESFTFDSTKATKYFLRVYAYNGSCSFNPPTFSKRSLSTTNNPPTLTAKSISRSSFNSGTSVTFSSTWNDPENKYIVDVKVRYRKQGTSSWTEKTMSHYSGYTFKITRTITGSSGTYEYQFRASDANTASGTRTNTTSWLSGGTFRINEITTVSGLPSSIDTPVNGTGWKYNQHGGVSYGGIGSANDNKAWDINWGSGYDDDGLPVYAVESGTVQTFDGWGGKSYGQLLIRHGSSGNYWYSGYLHMKNISSKTTFNKGDKIGEISRTGYLLNSAITSPHLHFAVYERINSKLVSRNISINKNISWNNTPIINKPPLLTSSSISPNEITSGQIVTFSSTWNDPENKYIVDVKVRYRKQGTSSWTEKTMNYISGTTFKKEEIITGSLGTYEYQFKASNANTASGTRTNTTTWLDGGTFNILDKVEASNLPILRVIMKGVDYTLNRNNTTLKLSLQANDIDSDLSYIQVDWSGDGREVSSPTYVDNDELITLSHTYPSTIGKKYYWSASAYDKNSNKHTLGGSVTIQGEWSLRDINYPDDTEVELGTELNKKWSISNVSGYDWNNYKIMDCRTSLINAQCTELERFSLKKETSYLFENKENPQSLGQYLHYYQIRDSNDNILLSTNGEDAHFYTKLTVVNQTSSTNNLDSQIAELARLRDEQEIDIDNCQNSLDLTNSTYSELNEIDLINSSSNIRSAKDSYINIERGGALIGKINITYDINNQSTYTRTINYPAIISGEVVVNSNGLKRKVGEGTAYNYAEKEELKLSIRNKIYKESAIAIISCDLNDNKEKWSNSLFWLPKIKTALKNDTELQNNLKTEYGNDADIDAILDAIARGTADGLRDIAKEYYEILKTATDIDNIISSAISIFKKTDYAKLKETAQQIKDMAIDIKHDIVEYVPVLKEALENAEWNRVDIAYYTAYTTTQVANEFVPLKKLKWIQKGVSKPLYLKKIASLGKFYKVSKLYNSNLGLNSSIFKRLTQHDFDELDTFLKNKKIDKTDAITENEYNFIAEVSSGANVTKAKKTVRNNYRVGKKFENVQYEKYQKEYPNISKQNSALAIVDGEELERKIDLFDMKTKLAIECKVGKLSNSAFIRLQLLKDKQLILDGEITTVEWHLTISPTTGKGGKNTISRKLQMHIDDINDELEQAGKNKIIFRDIKINIDLIKKAEL